MSGRPTDEEEFELLYGAEMEMLDELNEINNDTNTSVVNPAQIISRPQTSMSGMRSNVSSPQLSQISHGSLATSSVHRRLFDNPVQRVSSTPYYKSLGKSTNALTNLDDIRPAPNVGHKRRLNDLFGDIQDIDELSEFEYDSTAKKVKTDEERDLEMIEKILEARRLNTHVVNPLRCNEADKLRALNNFKRQNLSSTYPKWPCIPIVQHDHERIYVRFHSKEFENEEINEISLKRSEYESLLGPSKQKIWEDAKEIILKKSLQVEDVAIVQDIEFIPEKLEHNLWVDKYKPRRYMDLLSDESTNKSILQWLKMWDKIVFNREPKTKMIQDAKPGTVSTFNKKTGRFEKNGGWQRKTRNNLNAEFDEYGRPMQKIVLLCGPPGIGKTTLAHTIARHAGYVVRELNASDDRNPDAFRQTLENGTQMTSVLNVDKRPNCIILDEIDGAPQASIDFLIRFVQGSVTTKGKKSSGEKAAKFILKRPIICVCNDMYVPALRQLRQCAFVVNFPQVESERLAERLQTISRKEGLSTDMTSLIALAEKTGNDIRSCISMLQFYASANKPLTLWSVMKQDLGQKDQQKGLFEIWKSIFQIQRNRPGSNFNNNEDVLVEPISSIMTSAKRMQNILDIVHNSGDYERLTQGVHENYLALKSSDPQMNAICDATEWFCFSDKLQQFINQSQNYSVYAYFQYGFVMWHFLFAKLNAWPKITFPTKGYETSQKITALKMITSGLRKSINPTCKGIGDGVTFLLDAVPFIKRVICPMLRPVSLQLLSPREKSDLSHTVEIMSDLNLNYVQLKAVDGTYLYQLEPDIEQISHFTGISAPNLSYWVKQLISREVELVNVRRLCPKLNGNNVQNVQAIESNNTTVEATKKPLQTSPSNLPNHLRTLKPKIIQTKQTETVSKDFFGRLVAKPVLSLSQELASNSDAIVKSPIWYRYKEGFNNAVRKDLTMSDLLSK